LSYFDATVTAAANGGGGGGGGNWWFVPPTVAQFTLGSGDSTNVTLTNGQGGLLVDSGPPTTGDVNRTAYQVLANRNSTWDLKIRVEGLLPTDNYASYGLMMRDSISGRITQLSIWQDAGIKVLDFNGFTGFSDQALVSYTIDRPKWLRIQHDGTNYNFFMSADGEQWQSIGSIPDTSWLTNKADQVGLRFDYNKSSGIHTTMLVQYYSLIQ
jgi:hypothetical protein